MASAPEPTENKTIYRPARQTSAQVAQEWVGLSDAQGQRKAKTIIGMKAMRFIKMRCQPSGSNAPPIETDLILSFRSDGFLLKAVRNDAPKSIESRSEELQKCVVQSVWMASPYHGLDPKYYDIWKSVPLRVRVTG